MSKRHLFLGVSALPLLALAAVVFFKTTDAPNFLLVTIDTLRADHLGTYGYKRPVSPRIDALSQRGVVFENTYSVLPSTVPSHASLLFGTWPRIHGSTSNASEITNTSLAYLPMLLKNAGYLTAAYLSAQHLGKALESFPGFDELKYPQATRSANRTLRLAMRWWQANRDRKRFLWIHLWDPHSPYRYHPEHMPAINPAFNDDFERAYEFLPAEFSFAPGALSSMIDLYDNEIAFVDHHLGIALEELETASLLEHTALIITSDHGESLDELVTSHRYAFDHSEFLVEPQIRVPLVIIPPDRPHPGRASQLTSLIDLFPTVLEMAGLPIPVGSPGSSLLPHLSGRASSASPSLVFLQRRTFVDPPRPYLVNRQFGVRSPDFKLLYEPESGASELFRAGDDDLNLRRQESDVARQLEAYLRRWLQATDGVGSRPIPPEQLDVLKSLGYLQ